MRVFTVLLALLISGQAEAAIAYVQSKWCQEYSGTSVNCAFDSSVTSGNLIVAIVKLFNPSSVVYSVSDSQGNTYTLARQHGPGWYNFLAITYAKNVTGGSDTVTVNCNGSGSAVCAVGILEYSGIDTASPLDQVNSKSCPDSDPYIGSGSVTTTSNDELIVGAAMSPNSLTPSDGSTQRVSAGGYNNVSFTDRIVSSTGSYEAKWQANGQVAIALIATFKAPSSPTRKRVVIVQ